jgi:hypothetical protein
LGNNYPLFFNDISDLNELKDTKILHKKIMEANLYLQKMNKTPFMLDTFLSKITYDINKLKVNENKYKLTWLYYLDNNEYDIEKYISIFKQQISIESIKLIIINSLEDKIELLEQYNNDNITIIHVDPGLSMNEIYNIFVNNSTTEYLTFKNFNNIFCEENYSDLCINYLENNPTFDIIIFKNNQYGEKSVIDNDINKNGLEIQDEESDNKSYCSVTNNITNNSITCNDNVNINNSSHDESSYVGDNIDVINDFETSKVNYFIEDNDIDNGNNSNKKDEVNDFLSDTSDESSIFTEVSDNEKIFNLDNDKIENENNNENDNDNENDNKNDNDIESVSEETELENKLDECININNNENLLTYSQVCSYNFDDQNINILWRKSIHNYVHNFNEKFWLECYKNHLNIFEIQYNNLMIK